MAILHSRITAARVVETVHALAISAKPAEADYIYFHYFTNGQVKGSNTQTAHEPVRIVSLK